VTTTDTSPRPTDRMRELHAAARTSIAFAIAVLLSAAGCGSNAAAICERAGGTYVGGTCSRWGPRQEEAQHMCESRGGVYLRGQESCAFGEGGP
jgi:hypothetical protein